MIQWCNDCKRKSIFEINEDQDPIYINGKRQKECIKCGRYESIEEVKKYKKIQIPIGYEDIRMFEELADGHRKPFTWTFDKIDVEFIKDEEEDI